MMGGQGTGMDLSNPLMLMGDGNKNDMMLPLMMSGAFKR